MARGRVRPRDSVEIWACEFLQLYDALFRPIFVFFVVIHGTREVVHFNVTRWPTDPWTAQPVREATPFCKVPRYLIRDYDDKFGPKFAAIAKGTGIKVVPIPPRSPDLNPICERFLGSVRRECLDHVVISAKSSSVELSASTSTPASIGRGHIKVWTKVSPHCGISAEFRGAWKGHRVPDPRWTPS